MPGLDKSIEEQVKKAVAAWVADNATPAAIASYVASVLQDERKKLVYAALGIEEYWGSRRGSFRATNNGFISHVMEQQIQSAAGVLIANSFEEALNDPKIKASLAEQFVEEYKRQVKSNAYHRVSDYVEKELDTLVKDVLNGTIDKLNEDPDRAKKEAYASDH